MTRTLLNNKPQQPQIREGTIGIDSEQHETDWQPPAQGKSKLFNKEEQQRKG